MGHEFYADIIQEFNIIQKILDRPNDELLPVFAHILTIADEIFLGDPAILEAHATDLLPLMVTAKANYIANHGASAKQANAWIKSTFGQIFNYDFNHQGFTKVRSGELAYKHAFRLNMPTCPYCNEHFTFTIKNKKSKTRPQFDHFISKSDHPYFALSFYNLIPSCSVCNSSLKGKKPFAYSTHIHPFMDSVEGLISFQTEIDSVDFLVDKKDFEISIRKNPVADPGDVARAMKSADAFAILDRYQFHKEYAGEIITKSYIYNNSAIKELFEEYEVRGVKLFSSETEIIELLLGTYIHEDRLHKRLLTKLTKDISNEFKINSKSTA